jgi:DNA processing protein
MNDKLDDETYARAALTYLAEPADPWLAALLRAHGAAVALDAIVAGRLPAIAGHHLPRRKSPGSDANPTDGPDDGEAAVAPAGDPDPQPRTPAAPYAKRAMESAMVRWRTRLPVLPGPDEVLAFREAGIRLVSPGNPEWPGQLADLGDAQPYALWLRGNADLRFNCLRSVAIVGSRAATAYGSYVAAEFAASVAARGLAVISGGAFGVDAAAHRGALGADGVTVAVLAGGVDMPYPAAHTELFDAIAAQGVIASEWPPGLHVTRLRFLVRNRVIAALAAGTLVVEAGERSGALNTARHARDLNRRLMAVPGPVTSDLSAGCHQVIRDWDGLLVTSAAEVAEHLAPVGYIDQAEDLDDQEGRGQAPPLTRDLLDQDSAKVLDAMPRRGGMGTLRLAQRAGLAPATTSACLGRLATAGLIERCANGWRLRRV